MEDEPQRTDTNERASPEKIFAARLRQFRHTHGWSQQEVVRKLAERGIDWHQTMVAKTEAAARPVRLNEAIALAEIFGATLQMFLAEPVTEEALVAIRRRIRDLEDDRAATAVELAGAEQKHHELTEMLERSSEALKTAQIQHARTEARLIIMQRELRDSVERFVNDIDADAPYQRERSERYISRDIAEDVWREMRERTERDERKTDPPTT